MYQATLRSDPSTITPSTVFPLLQGNERDGGNPDARLSNNSHQPSERTDPRRIMIVEDEALVALDISQMLAENGFEVVAIAASESHAVQKAALCQPDLVIMDIKLKHGGDGLRATREITATSSIPVLFITAFRDDATMRGLRSAHPAGVVFKPFHRSILLQAVKTALEDSST